MTNDEKRAQKGELLLEYAETEQELAHLEKKANSIAGRLREVADWLESATNRECTFDGQQITVVGITRNIADSKYSEATQQAALNLGEEIRKLRGKLHGLQEQKRSFGLH